MQTGWKWFDNHYRYFESIGAMKTGWIKDKGVWYYLNPEDGIMLVGLHKVMVIIITLMNQELCRQVGNSLMVIGTISKLMVLVEERNNT